MPPYTPPKANAYDEFEETEEDVEREARRAAGEPVEEDEEDEEELRMRRAQMRARRDQEAQENERAASKRPKSNIQPDEPKVENPYESDETSYLIPILVAIGAFIPLLFCLCKL